MKECNCINRIFDLSISATGTSRMVIDDHSVWMDEDGFSGASSFDVSVKPLAKRGTALTVPLSVRGRTILTAEDLKTGSAEDCIKDGLYCFECDSCGVHMSITRAFLPNAYCAKDALVAKAVDDIDFKVIDKVSWLIAAVEAQTALDRIEEAKETYKILQDTLKDLICECCN